MPRKKNQISSRIKTDNSSEIIPLWKRYALTINEASLYFRIGENSLRRLVDEKRDANFVIKVGNRSLIKRELFEDYLSQRNEL